MRRAPRDLHTGVDLRDGAPAASMRRFDHRAGVAALPAEQEAEPAWSPRAVRGTALMLRAIGQPNGTPHPARLAPGSTVARRPASAISVARSDREHLCSRHVIVTTTATRSTSWWRPAGVTICAPAQKPDDRTGDRDGHAGRDDDHEVVGDVRSVFHSTYASLYLPGSPAGVDRNLRSAHCESIQDEYCW